MAADKRDAHFDYGADQADPRLRRIAAMRTDRIGNAFGASALIITLTAIAIVITSHHAWADVWSRFLHLWGF